MIAVQTENLSKVYKSSFGSKQVLALTGLNLEVGKGNIFGLLGPNGAGKTTLIKILLGITYPTTGSAKILDEDIANYQVRCKVGYLPENHKYPSYLTGENVLKFFGRLSGKDDKDLYGKINKLLDLVKLEKWRKTKIKSYSKGMMQRIGLAQALINDPDLIFLDEPTDGVDPIGRKEIRDLLMHLKDEGKTIFLNSHLLSEVEMITDRVAILNKGVLLREGKVSDLTEKREEYKIEIDVNGENKNLIDVISSALILNIKGNSLAVKVADVSELNGIIDNLRKNCINIKSILPQKETLEEMFISLIEKDSNSKSEGK